MHGHTYVVHLKIKGYPDETGFLMDFSVSPRRLDFFNSRGAGPGSFFAPCRPYHPGIRTPFRKGDRKLLVVPLSCKGIPFLSGSLFLFGLSAMKALFKTLLIGAKRHGSPIVYLFHSYEYAEYTGDKAVGAGSSPPETAEKRKALHGLYAKNRDRRYEDTFSLFKYILSFGSVRPMTGREFYHHSEIRGCG